MYDQVSSQNQHAARIGGIDAARALAVIGMLLVHVGPRDRDSFGEVIYNLPHGRASILFVFIAGIGISLLSARPGRLNSARLRLAWMAVVFLPLGLILQTLDHGIAVIVHHYAIFYLFGILAMALPTRPLGIFAAAASICGPLAYFMIRMHWPDFVGRETVAVVDRPLNIVDGLLLTGPYPLLTWAPALLWGMWVGRLDLGSGRCQFQVLLVGGAGTISAASIAAIALQILGSPSGPTDWRHLFSSSPHSQMPLWLIGSIGSAGAVTGAALVLVDRWPRSCRPLVALGQLALSFYVAHLIALHFFKDVLRRASVGEAMVSVLVLTVTASVFAVIWRRYFRRGPLETLLVWPFDLMAARRER